MWQCAEVLVALEVLKVCSPRAVDALALKLVAGAFEPHDCGPLLVVLVLYWGQFSIIESLADLLHE